MYETFFPRAKKSTHLVPHLGHQHSCSPDIWRLPVVITQIVDNKVLRHSRGTYFFAGSPRLERGTILLERIVLPLKLQALTKINITKNRLFGEFSSYFFASLNATRLRSFLLNFFNSIFRSTFFLFLVVQYTSPVCLFRIGISLSCDIRILNYVLTIIPKKATLCNQLTN